VDLGLDLHTFLTGAVVFLFRIVDVSLGTIRTISTVQGRTRTAFLLGFVEVCVVCRRKALKEILPIVGSIVPEAFYVTEAAGFVRSERRPSMQTPTGWRAVLKKK
jgi:Na+/alanine symporter